MVKVSIIVPIYNCVNFLQRTMDSLAAQTFKDFEIIMIEDGSQDGSKTLVQAYSQVPNIKVVWHENNQGLAESLNDGLEAATGQYIAIMHSDDISLPTRLERQVDYLDINFDRYLVGTWAQNIDVDGNVMRDGWWLRMLKRLDDDPELIHRTLLERNVFVHTSVMFRNTSEFFYDQYMVPSEDYSLWLEISEKYKLGIIRETLVQYRHHPKQISNTDGGNLMKDKARLAVERAKKRRGII